MVRKAKAYAGQGLLFPPESAWSAPNLSELPSWEGAKRVGIDVETCDPQLKKLGIGVRRDGYLVGVSFAIEDGPSYYLPMRHEAGGNLDPQKVIAYLTAQSKVFKGDVCGHNLQYDLDYLAHNDVVFRDARFFRDSMIADPLINELHMRYGLDAVAKRHGLAGKDETKLREAAAAYGLDPKKEMWRMHAKYVGEYADQDARLPLEILRRQERIIDDRDIWDIYNLESRLLPVLVKMRRRGVLIDQDAVARNQEYFYQREAELLAEVKRHTGVEIAVGDVWNTQAMAAPLQAIGIEPKLDKHKKPKINVDLLKSIEHPVGAALLRARQVNKARTTFLESIVSYMTNGRIHSTFNQMVRERDGDDEDTQGAAYGRLSSSDLNMQQQPSPERDPEIGGRIRGCYLPEHGELWAANDYSQQEPRWTTHFAAIAKLPKAQETADYYIRDPKADSYDIVAEGAGIKRKPAKTIYLGLCYGMQGKKLAMQLGLATRYLVLNREKRVRLYFDQHEEAIGASRKVNGRVIEVAGEEAQALLDTFNRKVPYVDKLARLAKSQAEKNGHVRTVGGRHCHFPQDELGNYDWTYKALNRVIQGSSGDQIKTAMVELDAAGHYLQIQVHDELGQSVKNELEAKAQALIMETCVPCRVPHRVDIELGENWGAAK